MVLTTHGPVLAHNCAQSAARNALCQGQLALEDLGYPYQLSVHDEELLAVEKNPATVISAREDLLSVFGPGNNLGWGWAVCVNPEEITCSQSMHEIPQKPDWWASLPTHPELLESLP